MIPLVCRVYEVDKLKDIDPLFSEILQVLGVAPLLKPLPRWITKRNPSAA